MTYSDQSLSFDLVLPSMVAANQKQVLRLVAMEAARLIGIQERILSDRLADKEKQTPSAMGGGIALPHLHISSLTEPVSVFVKLKKPVDFKAADNVPVDIICLLLTPEREGAAYLRTLARLSRLLRDAQFCSTLRNASDEKTIRSLFGVTSARMMAA